MYHVEESHAAPVSCGMWLTLFANNIHYGICCHCFVVRPWVPMSDQYVIEHRKSVGARARSSDAGWERTCEPVTRHDFEHGDRTRRVTSLDWITP
jgi:hypothetical protein